VIAGAAVAVAAAAVVGAGSAAGAAGFTPAPTATQDTQPDTEEPEQPDKPLTGTDLDRATKAALDHTGGGTVTETETGDDGAAYGVEVRKPDGRHVEVALDSGFGVVGEEADDGDAD
jgi:uncharacterized membrane protein YkoI